MHLHARQSALLLRACVRARASRDGGSCPGTPCACRCGEIVERLGAASQQPGPPVRRPNGLQRWRRAYVYPAARLTYPVEQSPRSFLQKTGGQEAIGSMHVPRPVAVGAS